MCSHDNMRMMCTIEDRLLKALCEETADGLESVSAEELGEVVDMVKDMAEAKYYASVVEAMNAEKYGDLPERHSEGRHGPVWDDGSMMHGGAYDHYKKAREEHRGHSTPESRRKMEEWAEKHMKEMEESVKDIWKDSDQMHRDKIKSALVSMANGLM